MSDICFMILYVVVFISGEEPNCISEVLTKKWVCLIPHDGSENFKEAKIHKM